MRWCLEKEPALPVLCICRGMQMLSVVSGAQMIQDLQTYFEAQGLPYSGEHRMEPTAEHANGAADASRFMDYESALCYFRALAKKGD